MISLSKPVLTIVIPALNEESAIGGTLTRCIAVSDDLLRELRLERIEWIVVSDGSSDQTVAIAKSYSQVRVVEWAVNRGYGAAIQHGFEIGDGSLIGFLDADGTCDPALFADLCRQILDHGADVAIGSRMSPGSRMPRIRRIGNWIYAILLGFLTGRSVTDAASGMRVLTREAWKQLRPLPTGLHFTPAMSAKALATQMRVVEVPIPYADRIGQSKLNVVRDGFRFLNAILGGILSVRPDRFLGLIVAICASATIFIAAYPVEFYLRNRRLEEWMNYRFFACYVLGQAAFSAMAATGLAHRLASFGPQNRPTDSFLSSAAAKVFEPIPVLALTVVCGLVCLSLIWTGLVEYLTHGTVSLHWSRMIVATFLLSMLIQAVITSILFSVIGIWVEAKRVRQEDE